MTDFDARDVLDKYLAVLAVPEVGIARDVTALGHPKEIIRLVLQHCLRAMDMPEQQKVLREAYLGLASFQPLTEAEREALARLQGLGPLAEAGAEQATAQANQIVDVTEPLRSLIGKLKAEAAILAQDLKSLSEPSGPPG